MKKFIVSFVLSLALGGCFFKDPTAHFQKITEVDFRKGQVVQKEDTHGGLHGDGRSVLILEDSKEEILKEINQAKGWKNLPLSDDIQIFLKQSQEQNEVDLTDLMKLTHGKYYFYDRQDQGGDPHSEKEFLSRPSYNLSLIVYDEDSHRIYLVKYDS